jgi:hypothetical protein
VSEQPLRGMWEGGAGAPALGERNERGAPAPASLVSPDEPRTNRAPPSARQLRASEHRARPHPGHTRSHEERTNEPSGLPWSQGSTDRRSLRWKPLGWCEDTPSRLVVKPARVLRLVGKEEARSALEG